jgi:DNA-binding CsgD family transcriptional regulator
VTRADTLERGRESFQRQAWGDAFAWLSAADREAPLEPTDLERLATAAFLTGRDVDWADGWARAHQGYLSAGEPERAARCAFWLGFGLLNNGEPAQGGGWLARARRLLDDGRLDCVEQGYLLVPAAIKRVRDGDATTGYNMFLEVAAIGERFGDRDLATLGLHGQRRALIHRGETSRGVALLDEAMVAVTAGLVSPLVVGGIYCSVIEACHQIFDLRRAQEWTAALSQWCASQPDLAPYRGHCLIRRAEILQLHGAWPDALKEAERARERLSQPTVRREVGAAFYQLAELHRLRGEFAEAEAAYREAGERGRTPQPGLALLRLAQGQLDAATAAIRRVASEGQEDRTRSRVLAAYVEIVLAADDIPAACAAADELAELAGRLDTPPLLRALTATAMGSVLLAEHDARGALAALRSALSAWRDLDAPYEMARVRVLIALACRSLDDADAADLELDAARRAFQQLGAGPDLAHVEALSRSKVAGGRGRLTAREVEVITLVASGRTNRAIAGKLGISEKTVARHISNIFTKLGLSSRAAATAYAYQHDLVEPRPT